MVRKKKSHFEGHRIARTNVKSRPVACVNRRRVLIDEFSVDDQYGGEIVADIASRIDDLQYFAVLSGFVVLVFDLGLIARYAHR